MTKIQSFPKCFLLKYIWQGKLRFQQIFLPYIENIRLKLYDNKYENKCALLICDGMTDPWKKCI